ncbi:MAG: hypothetical protein AB7Q16_21485 [Vicinamibacterales bacterium]
MQLGLEAVRVSSYGSAPWWLTANVIGRGRWVLLAVILWWALPRLAGTGREVSGSTEVAAGTSRPEAWREVGVAVLAIPLLWVLATWMVSAIRFTLLGSWATEGRVFMAPEYYRGLLIDYTPWLVAGATLLGVRKHL